MTYKLLARSLSGGYSGRPILNNVSLEALPGQVTSLIGANGCGKSTLLKTLARVLEPSDGEVLINEKNITSFTARNLAKHLSYLPQSPLAPEGMTVEQLVAQGRYPHRGIIGRLSKDDKAAISRALNATHLTQLRTMPVSQLSGGQRQRAWIAMTLAQEAPIMLLDEPTTYLDLKVQVDIMSVLREVAKEQQRAVIVVLHDLNLAAAFSDQLVMMKAGRLCYSGTPKEAFTADALAEVFGLDAHVSFDPVAGHPVCFPNVQQGASL